MAHAPLIELECDRQQPTLPKYEALLREQLERMGAARRAELLYTLELTDYERAGAIGELYGYPATRSMAE